MMQWEPLFAAVNEMSVVFEYQRFTFLTLLPSKQIVNCDQSTQITELFVLILLGCFWYLNVLRVSRNLSISIFEKVTATGS